MKLSAIILLLFFCILQTNFVKSGVILDKIKTGVDDTRHRIRCGIGGLIATRHNECDETYNEVDTGGQPHKKNTTPRTDVKSHENHGTAVTVTEKSQGQNSTFQGRRVIAVGANCPEGYRGDGKGNCREEY